VTWPIAVTGIASMTILAAIVAVVITQLSAGWRARTSVIREEEYHKLADEAVSAQREAARLLELVRAELSTIGQRTGEVERMLREVDDPRAR
jgi:hypothetical protein